MPPTIMQRGGPGALKRGVASSTGGKTVGGKAGLGGKLGKFKHHLEINRTRE
jgi:hypothetical protein